MSKFKKLLAILLSATLCTGGVIGIAACSNDEKNVELPAYTGNKVDTDGKMLFNHEIFYRNDNKGIGPDPFILDDTQEGRTGYYYAYSTLGYNYVYRSKDLSDWEGVGQAIDIYGNEEYGKVAHSDVWAPEVIYDAEANGGEGQYFMFFSGSPTDSTLRSVMYLGVSDKPYGPFKLVNFLDEESCDGNLHDYDTEKYSEYFAKYLLFDPEDFATAGEPLDYANFQAVNKNGVGYLRSIDPHPYVDPVADEAGNHKKYLYFCGNGSTENPIFCVEMENWYSPKWDTFTAVTRAKYYTVADYEKAKNNEAVETVPYESGFDSGVINEGPTLYYNTVNKKYYLTYSTGAYENASYQVAQAVGDTPMGPFRKLTENENGVFLSGGLQGSEEVSGSGHHGLFTVGDKLYAVYHRHNDFSAGGAERNGAIDEITWITVKDPDGKDLLAMYSNGPSTTLQPKICDTKYRNVAGEATVSGGKLVSGSSLDYITDGLLSSYYTENDGISNGVKETYLSETSTIEFNFSSEKTVRAVMVYNSKLGEDVFLNISRIEILSEGINYVIQNVAFDKSFYSVREFDGSVTYVSPCSAAFAEFDEIKTTRIRVTVEVPSGQSRVGLSEVRILGY